MRWTVVSCIAGLGIFAAVPVWGAPAVEDLSWLTGSWIQEREGTVVRETWTAPLGGAMGGVTQTSRPGGKPSIEFMRVTVEGGVPTFTAVIDGQPPTPFALATSASRRVVFENVAHDFPQRVIYWRCGDDGHDLCARIEGTVSGKLQSEEWHYTAEAR